jgi:hypothetical protein
MSELTNLPTLASIIRDMTVMHAELAEHEAAAKKKTADLQQRLAALQTSLNQGAAGLDLDKIALAETVIYATDYSRGGAERGGAVKDAIKFLATGEPLRTPYGDLRREYFGTKNYAHWSGQRSDHTYGCGPRHGSTCFEVGLRTSARNRDLTEAERDAAIYYLLNLPAIQDARPRAGRAA